MKAGFIVCGTPKQVPEGYPGELAWGTCERCGTDVVLSENGRALLVQHPALVMVCLACSKDVMKMMQAELDEESRKRDDDGSPTTGDQ